MYEDARNFLVSLIEPDVWARAVWRGTAFLWEWEAMQPPDLAFIFGEEQAAREVFSGLRSKVGREDEEELLRIAIIEGSFGGNENAYGVNVGPNLHNVFRHFGYTSEEYSNERFGFLTRFLRMNPRTLDPLAEFKRRFQQVGACRLIPSIMRGNSIVPIDELSILKRELFFRKQSEITPTDEDAISLVSDSPPPR